MHGVDRTLQERKARLRQLGYAARAAQANKRETSVAALRRLVALREYQDAHTVLWYLHVRSELRTREFIAAALAEDKRIAIPYCTLGEGDQRQLGLWHLQDLAELVAGAWSILEPPSSRHGEPGRRIPPAEVDLVVVPGVAFDPYGNRLGNGQGYYDGLLPRMRASAALIGVCYQAQLFAHVPAAGHDVRVHKIVTEKAVYLARLERPRPPRTASANDNGS